MDDDVKKYLIKKSKWWKTGNFNIFDGDHKLLYTVTSPLFVWKKSLALENNEGDVCAIIDTVSIFPHRFSISGRDVNHCELTKKLNISNHLFDVNCFELDGLMVESNMWRTKFEFIQSGHSIALMSHNSMAFGEFGLAIKPIPKPLTILSMACVIAFLKETGQI